MNKKEIYFKPSYNRVIVMPLDVKPTRTNGIVLANGASTSSIISKYENHPKQARIIAVGQLDERYQDQFKAGDQVLLRLQTMVELICIQGQIYGSIAPSDIIGVTTYHKDLALTADKEFFNNQK